ncbi:YkgB family protein [Vibrio neptunius]|uniref:YkgB family protein n=1 Tax=Vibrio neptunius TaxID=170651 RepID=UPI0019D26301|nr:YkgB family protein [Vibrio neptunius]MBN3574553.1 YkgB family protein [Vibrio neptunius]QXX05801.1 YkgB family protein [Vibrio neptunius]
MHVENKELKQSHIGYNLGVIGVALVLAWIGIYKFTPTEAKLIEPLVVNHPAMNWLYDIISVQAVSNLIGATEIIVAIGLIAGFKNAKIAYVSGIAAAVIFVATLSFLLTTPNTWKVSDGILVTNFFLVKDILFLAISISVIERNKPLVQA